MIGFAALQMAICLLSCQLFTVWGFRSSYMNLGGVTCINSRLYAKHPIKKIIKRKMDERPRKKRPSDIHRNNVNLDKCINKIDPDIPEYRILKPEEVEEGLKHAAKCWEEGDPTAKWHEITAEFHQQAEVMRQAGIERNVEPPPPGTDLGRKVPLVKLTRAGDNHFYGKNVLDVDMEAFIDEVEAGGDGSRTLAAAEANAETDAEEEEIEETETEPEASAEPLVV